MPRPALVLLLASAITAMSAEIFGCARPVQCDAVACAPACPRDAARDASGRCVCVEGMLPLLGACVPPAVGDAFCGPSAVLEPDGCVFHSCGGGQRLDVASGSCLPVWAVAPLSPEAACTDAGLPLLQAGQLACASPDATCPRGSRRASPSTSCERWPRCPPGSLSDEGACRPIVTVGRRLADRRVDVGAWAAIVLGFDGGRGSREVCQPIEQHANALGLAVGAGTGGRVDVTVTLAVPDQDISRVGADVHAEASLSPSELAIHAGAGAGPTSSDLERFVAADVATLVESLRAVGGEATAASVAVHVRCLLGQ